MTTVIQQLKQCLAGIEKLRSWMELAGLSSKRLDEVEEAVNKQIEREAAA